MDKHIIWSDNIELEDWKDYIEDMLMTEDDQYIAQFYWDYDIQASKAWDKYCKEHPELEEMKVKDYRQFKKEFDENWRKDNPIQLPTVDEYMKENYEHCWEDVVETNNHYLDDERANLDIETEGRILIVANRGLWNGRRADYSFAPRNNISACLTAHTSSMCDCEFWVEYNDNHELEFKSKDIHHDGTNYYTFRELKPDLSDDDMDTLEAMLSEGKADEALELYTLPLGQKIQEVYGFKLDDPKADEPLDLTGQDKLER